MAAAFVRFWRVVAARLQAHPEVSNRDRAETMLLQRTVNIFAKLPREKHRKLRQVQTAFRASCAAANESHEHERRIRGDLHVLRERIEALELEAKHGGLNKEQYRHVMSAIADLRSQKDDASAVVSEFKEHIVSAGAAHVHFSYLSRVLDWLETVALDRSMRLVAVETPVAKLGRGEKYSSAIDAVRSKLEENDLERRRVNGAQNTKSEQIRLMRRDLDELAASGKPTYWPANREKPAFDLTSLAHGHNGGFYFWLHKELIDARLTEIIQSQPGLELSNEDRERCLGELASARLQIERQEEAFIVAAAAIGEVIPRRANLDPRAFLEVREA